MAIEPPGCTLAGDVFFHLDLIRQSDDLRPLRLLVEGEDLCPATADSGPFVNAAGLLVLTPTALRCVGAAPAQPPEGRPVCSIVMWEVPLARMLLVRREKRFQKRSKRR